MAVPVESSDLAALRSALEAQREAFQQCLERVVRLRIAKAERDAAGKPPPKTKTTEKTKEKEKEIEINSGSAAADRALCAVREWLRGAESASESLAAKLQRAARAVVTPNFPVDRSAGERATTVVFATRCEVRGTRKWAQRHCRRCARCRCLSEKSGEKRFEKSGGLAETSRVSQSAAVKFAARLFRAHPVALRDATAAMDLLRVTFVLGADVAQRESISESAQRESISESAQRESLSESAQRESLSELAQRESISELAQRESLSESAQRESLSESAQRESLSELAQRAAAAAERWAERALRAARERVRNAAAKRENEQCAAIAEVLLHAMKTRVTVQPCENALRVDVALAVPFYALPLNTIIDVLADAAQRDYLVKRFVVPIARSVGECVGAAAAAEKGVAVAARAIDTIVQMAQRGKYETQKSAAVSAGPFTMFKETVHAVLLALAVFGTSIELDAAVPRMDDDDDDTHNNNKNKNNNNNNILNNIQTVNKDNNEKHDEGEGNDNSHASASASNSGAATRVKVAALRVARHFLQLLTPPPDNTNANANEKEKEKEKEKDAANVSLRLRGAPTAFLEVLNRAFSSSRRLPSTARASLMDSLASPKSQISYGLKLFSEIVVDVHRPYAPDCGVVIADETNEKNENSCTPRADIPPDIVRANIAVAEEGKKLIRRLSELTESAAAESETERKGKEMAKRLVEEIFDEEVRAELRTDFEALNVKITDFKEAQLYVLLPFGLNVSGSSQETTEVLYLRLHFQKSASPV